MRIDGVVISVKLISPDEFQQLLAGVGLSGMRCKEKKKFKFLCGQINSFPLQLDLAPFSVDGKIAELYVGRFFRRFRFTLHRLDPAEDRFHPSNEFADTKRFCEIIIGADFKSEHLVQFLRFCRQHQYRCVVFVGANAAANFQTVHIREHNIEHNKIECAFLCLPISFASVVRSRYLAPEVLQVDVQQFGDIFIVFDHQHMFHNKPAKNKRLMFLPMYRISITKISHRNKLSGLPIREHHSRESRIVQSLAMDNSRFIESAASSAMTSTRRSAANKNKCRKDVPMHQTERCILRREADGRRALQSSNQADRERKA